MALLSVQDAGLTLGNRQLLDHTELFVEQGDRLCIVGRNGVGKSSLLSVLAGRLPLDYGERHEEPGLRIGYVQQAVPDHWKGSVFSVTADALGKEGHLLAAAHLIASDRRDLLPPDLAKEADVVMEHGEVWERHGEVLGVINSLALDPEADFSTLSGGTRRLFLKAEPAAHGLPLLCTRSCMTWVSQRRRFPHGFCRKPRKRERIRACADFCKLHAARGLRSSRAAPHRQTSVRPPLLFSKIRHVAASWQPPKTHVKRAAPPAPESASQAGAACRPPFKCRQACVPLSDG